MQHTDKFLKMVKVNCEILEAIFKEHGFVIKRTVMTKALGTEHDFYLFLSLLNSLEDI